MAAFRCFNSLQGEQDKMVKNSKLDKDIIYLDEHLFFKLYHMLTSIVFVMGSQ